MWSGIFIVSEWINGVICLKKRMLALALTLIFISALTVPVLALDDDEFNGYSADTLVIKVGYFGGPYYEKAVFSLADLWAMNVIYADYTFIDNMPSVVIDHVAGVSLSDIVAAAGIDIGSVQTFYFWTRDKSNDYYTSYSKTELIDTPRYCYYSLPDNYDSEEGVANEYADSHAEHVDTLIALADDWNRVIAGAAFGSDYQNLNTNTRFRLVMGQNNTWEHTASRSAKWVHEIVIELGGAPTVTLNASVLDGEVGSILRTEVSISAESAVLENEAAVWESSDESVASVDQDGNITICEEGTAVITVAFAGTSASVTVTGVEGESGGVGAIVEEPGGSDNGQQNDSDEGAAQESVQEPAADDSQTLSEADDIGNAVQINPPEVQSESSQGGIQNWRVYEMSKTSTELGNIEADNPLGSAASVSAAVLFVGSGAIYAAKFNFDVGRPRHAYKRKPQ